MVYLCLLYKFLKIEKKTTSTTLFTLFTLSLK